MKIRILLLYFSLLAGALNGQSFVVMSVKGNPTFKETASGTSRSLAPTQVLSPDAVVSLSAGSSVRLVYQGQQISLAEAGNYPLKSFASGKKQQSSSFVGRFFNYIYDGVVNTSGQKNIEEYHKHYITQSSGGIKGFAGGAFGVEILSAVTGSVAPGSALFQWFSSGDSVFYDFQIADYQNDGLVFKALLKDTSLAVDLGQLVLEPGRKYYWFVQLKQLGESSLGFALVDDPSLRSPKMEFVLSDQPEQQVLQDLESYEEYKTASATERLLMAAQALEENRMIYAAQGAFLEAMEKEPGNPLARRVYGAFLIRQGLLLAATNFVGP
ncbi:MAG: hypothetical protein WA004_08925 [Saprospiraceae bacterium]